MKALLQRVTRGEVVVDGETVGAIDAGLVVLLGVRKGDTARDAELLARKTANLRIFDDREGRMNRSVLDTGGRVLAVSQFTLYADTRKGNRPGFTEAAEPGVAEALYESFVAMLRRILGEDAVATGRFRTTMAVELVNDGPVTVELRCEDGRLV